VFIEIFTVYLGRHPHHFVEHRRSEEGDESFHANSPRMIGWLDLMAEINNGIMFTSRIIDTVKAMVDDDPARRPTALDPQATATDTYDHFESDPCCISYPEKYVVHDVTPSD
jgi:hypothetical protein